jgi:probable phosphoglycerate mutase
MIRHAEAEGNLFRRMHGQYDSSLTPRGYRQTAKLAERFDGVHIDAVYSSDLTRARETARAIYERKELPLILEPRLRELHFGIWEDMPFGEVLRSEGERWKLFEQNPWDWSVEGAETTETVRARVTEAILDIAAQNDGKSVALFTHGCAIRAFFCGIYGITSPEGLESVPYVWNTAVTRMECRDGLITIDYAGDIEHIGSEPELTGGRERPKKLPGWVSDTNMRYVMEPDGAVETYSVMLGDSPAGALELDTARGAENGEGWITRYELSEELRGCGLGAQPLGQAISRYRALGRDRLCLAPADSGAEDFFVHHGFEQTGRTGAMERKILL